MYIFIYTYAYVAEKSRRPMVLSTGSPQICMYIYIQICMYIYIYVYIYTYIYLYLPDTINHLCSLSGSKISGNYFAYRSVQMFKSFAEDQTLEDLILHTRLCGTGFITQHG